MSYTKHYYLAFIIISLSLVTKYDYNLEPWFDTISVKTFIANSQKLIG